jgi:hypothetical protein
VNKPSKYPLTRGDKIRLVAPPHNELEVETAGAAGIKVKERMGVLWWHERGVMWTSEKLDRQDAAKAQFKQASTGCGKKED